MGQPVKEHVSHMKGLYHQAFGGLNAIRTSIRMEASATAEQLEEMHRLDRSLNRGPISFGNLYSKFAEQEVS